MGYEAKTLSTTGEGVRVETTKGDIAAESW